MYMYNAILKYFVCQRGMKMTLAYSAESQGFIWGSYHSTQVTLIHVAAPMFGY